MKHALLIYERFQGEITRKTSLRRVARLTAITDYKIGILVLLLTEDPIPTL